MLVEGTNVFVLLVVVPDQKMLICLVVFKGDNLLFGLEDLLMIVSVIKIFHWQHTCDSSHQSLKRFHASLTLNLMFLDHTLHYETM